MEFIILIGAVVVIGLWIWGMYNKLVRLNEQVTEAWHDITVQLKYRADLLPNLVETVKGYAKHEKETFSAVTEARGASMGAKDPKAAGVAEAAMQQALTQVLAVAESYPELKANENFMDLQYQLKLIEDKLQAVRRFYNNGVKDLNTQIQMFPVSLFGGFGFKQRDYFEVSEEEKEKIKDAPKVSF